MASEQSELNMGTTGSNSGATPEQIRDDIRRTRANMDETVDAISSARKGNVSDQARCVVAVLETPTA